MNYYPRYPGHYLSKTLHLTMEQDGAYTRLLDWYYANERPIPHAQRYAIARTQTASEKRSADVVLGEFFVRAGDDWGHDRAEQEIVKSRPKIEAARENGKKGGNPLKKAGYNEPGFVYAVQRESGGPIKVGITKYVQQRYSGLRKKVGAIVQIALAEVQDMGSVEAAIHQAFSDRLDGEWIDVTADELLPVWQMYTQPSTQPNGQSSRQRSTQTPQPPIPSIPVGEVIPPLPPDSPGDESGGVSPVVGLVVQLRQRGFGLTPSHPDLLAAHAAGVPHAAILRFADKYRTKPIGYAIAAAVREHTEGVERVGKQEALEDRNRAVAADWAAQETEHATV